MSTAFPALMEKVAATLMEKSAGARWISGAQALKGATTGAQSTVQRLAKGRATNRLSALDRGSHIATRGVKKSKIQQGVDYLRRVKQQQNAQSFRAPQPGAKSSVGPSNALHRMKRNDPGKYTELQRRVAAKKTL